MPAKGHVSVRVSGRLCTETGRWLVLWTPPAPTVLGGAFDVETEALLRELGKQLLKAGRRRQARKYISIERHRAEAFATLFHPSVGGLRLWPRSALKLRRRFEEALRRRRGPRRREMRRGNWLIDGEPDGREHVYRRRRRIERARRLCARKSGQVARIDARAGLRFFLPK